MATRLAGAFAAAASARAAVQLIDAATKIENSLKVTGLAGEDLAKVYDQLFTAAQKNAAPIESLTTLYSKLALTQKELGVTNQELIGFTDKVALALRVGGTDAQAASGALLQLSQALGGGVVRAEEFNSILEGAPTIMQATAAGLKEASGSVAQLRKLVVDGKVSSEAFFRAFEAGSVILDKQVAGAEMTVSQQFVRLQNVLIDTAGKIDEATGASGRMGKSIETLAGVIRGFGDIVVETSDSDLGRLLGWFDDAIGKADEFRKVMGGISGILSKLSQINQDMLTGREIGSGLSEKNIQGRIDAAFEGTGRSPKTGRLPGEEVVKNVSLADYDLPANTKTKKGKRERADEYAREIVQIRERTAALTAAYAAQASLNPLIEDYGYTIEKARARQELMTAAQKAGKEITPQLAADIDAAAEAYARAGAQAERLAEKQDELRQRAEDALNATRDVVGGMIDGFIEGEKAADIFASSLKKIGKTLADDVLSSIFSIKNATAGGGWMDGIFSLFGGSGGFKANTTLGNYLMGIPGFASGTNNAPGGLALVGERGPELVNLPRGAQVIPNHQIRAPVMPDLSAVRSETPSASIVYAPVYNVAQGADPKAIAELQQAQAQDRRDFKNNVVAAIVDAHRRNVRGI
nr:tape measure protein [Shinella fusca]